MLNFRLLLSIPSSVDASTAAMSSFRRRVTAVPIPGTRPSPYNSLPLLSTGLSSLDDLLGGGLPLSSSLLLEADSPTSYADLLLKFWISQGVECKQDVVIVGSELECPLSELIKSLPGVEGAGVTSAKDEEEELEEARKQTEKMKIAFRYEGMKQHAVTVPEPSASTTAAGENDVYCSMFDLTTNRILRAADYTRLHLIDVDSLSSPDALPVDLYELLYQKVDELIKSGGYSLPHNANKPRRALRIAISSFGSPAWGSSTPAQLYTFLHRLRALLRTSSSSAVVTFPISLYRQSHPTLITRLEHASDGVIELQSTSASASATAAYPKHSGLLRIPKLPSLGSLVAPSVKLSVLRGMGGEGAENNLGFRVKRRRFVIETVNADDPLVADEPEKKKPTPKAKEPPAPPVVDQAAQRKAPLSVGFADAIEEQPKKVVKPKSVSATIHSRPELFEF